MQGNNKFVHRGQLIWVFHSVNQRSLLSETGNNRREREHDVCEQSEAQRKACTQCEVKESSINHSPNRFSTCVRCLPRNTRSHTNSCPALQDGHVHQSQTRDHTIKTLEIKHLQSVEQTPSCKAQIVVLPQDFGMTFLSGAHTAVQIHALHTCDQTTLRLI